MINVTPTKTIDEPSNDVMVSGRQHMVQIMQMVAAEEQAKCNHDAKDAAKNPSAYRFRYNQHIFTERGVVGKVSENVFWNMCRAAVFDYVSYANQVGLNTNWAVIAWEISSTKGRIRTHVPAKHVEWDRFTYDPKHYSGGVPSPQTTQRVENEVDQLCFRYCVVDNYQNDEIDTLMHKQGRPDMTKAKYLETGDHRLLPPVLRAHRESALALLRDYVGVPEAVEEETLSKKQVRQVGSLRKSGETWKEIADLYGMHWSALRKAYNQSNGVEHEGNGMGESGLSATEVGTQEKGGVPGSV